MRAYAAAAPSASYEMTAHGPHRVSTPTPDAAASSVDAHVGRRLGVSTAPQGVRRVMVRFVGLPAAARPRGEAAHCAMRTLAPPSNCTRSRPRADRVRQASRRAGHGGVVLQRGCRRGRCRARRWWRHRRCRLRRPRRRRQPRQQRHQPHLVRSLLAVAHHPGHLCRGGGRVAAAGPNRGGLHPDRLDVAHGRLPVQCGRVRPRRAVHPRRVRPGQGLTHVAGPRVRLAGCDAVHHVRGRVAADGARLRCVCARVRVRPRASAGGRGRCRHGATRQRCRTPAPAAAASHPHARVPACPPIAAPASTPSCRWRPAASPCPPAPPPSPCSRPSCTSWARPSRQWYAASRAIT